MGFRSSPHSLCSVYACARPIIPVCYRETQVNIRYGSLLMRDHTRHWTYVNMAAFECLVVSNKSNDGVSRRSRLIPQVVVAFAICFGCGLPFELRARPRVFTGTGEDPQPLKRRCVSIANQLRSTMRVWQIKTPIFNHEQ